jgi:hypothetical protein
MIISWANRTEPTEPDAVVEVAEVMEVTRYGMEEELERMGARAACGNMAVVLNQDDRGDEKSNEDPPDSKRGKTRESRVRNRRKRHKRRTHGLDALVEDANNEPDEERGAEVTEGSLREDSMLG